MSSVHNATHTFLGVVISIALALWVSQATPRQKSLPFAVLAILEGLSAAALLLFAQPQIYFILPAILLVVALLVVLHVDFFYCLMSLLLGCLFTQTYVLLFRFLLLVSGDAIFPGYVLDILYLVVLILCWCFQVVILPEPSALPAVNNREQQRRISLSLVYVALSIAVMDTFLYFSLALLNSLHTLSRLALTLLGVSITVLILGYARKMAFSAVERMEAIIDKQYQNDLLSFMQVIRSQRHDFNFHMRTISALIGQGQYDACDEYVQQMVKNASAMNDMLPLYHPATSAMINAFRELALQKGIELEVNISSDLAKIPCTVYEINAVIGNLLQNAIDELEHAHSRGPIQLLILFRGGYYIIRVSNPCEMKEKVLQEMFRPGYSTKKSHEGLGLAAVRRIASRYDGMVFPEFAQGELRLIVQIPFCP